MIVFAMEFEEPMVLMGGCFSFMGCNWLPLILQILLVTHILFEAWLSKFQERSLLIMFHVSCNM
jgi:hypothetical protein